MGSTAFWVPFAVIDVRIVIIATIIAFIFIISFPLSGRPEVVAQRHRGQLKVSQRSNFTIWEIWH
jgi:hypothetical protein